jgi:hypothetical protein
MQRLHLTIRGSVLPCQAEDSGHEWENQMLLNQLFQSLRSKLMLTMGGLILLTGMAIAGTNYVLFVVLDKARLMEGHREGDDLPGSPF